MKILRSCLIWFTGLSGSGKTTLSSLLASEFQKKGCGVLLLDGDVMRSGLNKDLGFSGSDRAENIRRVAEVSRLILGAGLTVIAAFITPLEKERRLVRELVMRDGHEFVEIYIKASLETCERRDPKGLYKKARQGLVKNFTGIDSVYEEPRHPEITLDTELNTEDECLDALLDLLSVRDIIKYERPDGHIDRPEIRCLF